MSRTYADEFEEKFNELVASPKINEALWWTYEHKPQLFTETAMAILLQQEHAFFNFSTGSFLINCSDMFAWATADCEKVETEKELSEAMSMWALDRRWGLVKWVAIKRNQQPQKPVVKAMKETNSWSSMMESLDKNPDNK